MMTSENRPIMYEKISISPKRFLTVKLWPPTAHPEWGMSRASIEIQESRVEENKDVTYGNAIRVPCGGSAALVAAYLQQFLLEGRRLNREFPSVSEENNVPATSDPNELKDLILSEFAGVQTSKSRAYNTLIERGFSVNRLELYTILETLANEGSIKKEERIHTESKDKYDWWTIPAKSEAVES